MIFSPKEIVGGLSAKVARDCLFSSKWEPIKGPETFAWHAKVTQAEAQQFFEHCIEKRWLEPAAEGGYYELTQLGIQAGAARIGKPLSRAKAEQLLGEVLQRARDWNSLSAVGVKITEIRAIGSYLSEVEFLGDLDLIVDFELKPGFDSLACKQSFSASQGWALPRHDLAILFYWQGAMYRYLKARQAALSFGAMSDLKRLGCPSKVVFSTEVEHAVS